MNTKKIMVICILSVLSFPSLASTEKVSMAMEAAQTVCSTPNQYGSGSSLKISAQAKANVGKIIRQLASADGNVNAEYVEGEWLGVRQEELASAMRDSNSCKSRVFSLVMQDFGGSGWQMSTPVVNNQPYLSHTNGGASPVSPTTDYLTPNPNTCFAESGSRVQFLDQTSIQYLNLVKVRVLSGTCQGYIGWVNKDFYRI